MSDVSDLRNLSLSLSSSARDALPKLGMVLQKGAADIERDAKILAPVDTGNLRSSITRDTTISGASVETEVGPTAEYGIYLEYGTSRMAPQPYMGPAFERNVPAIEAAAAQVAGDIV